MAVIPAKRARICFVKSATLTPAPISGVATCAVAAPSAPLQVDSGCFEALIETKDLLRPDPGMTITPPGNIAATPVLVAGGNKLTYASGRFVDDSQTFVQVFRGGVFTGFQ
jgi:hypothetical protein